MLARLQAGQLDAGFFYVVEAKTAHVPTVPLTPIYKYADLHGDALNNAENAERRRSARVVPAEPEAQGGRKASTGSRRSNRSSPATPRRSPRACAASSARARAAMRTRASSPLPWLGGLLALYLLVSDRRLRGAPRGGRSGLARARLGARDVAVDGDDLDRGDHAARHAAGLSAGPHARRRGARAAALVALPLALPALMSGILLLYVVGPFTLPRRTVRRQADRHPRRDRAGADLRLRAVPDHRRARGVRGGRPGARGGGGDAGARALARFARVAVPAALPGIGAGLLLTWLRAFARVRRDGDPRLPPVLAARVHVRAVRRDRPAGHDAARRRCPWLSRS